jgi:hypothetical protein
MKSTIHNLTEEITKAIGPIFRERSNYNEILPAMCLVMARVIQSTPDKGNESKVFEDACEQIGHALTEFLKIENEFDAKKAEKRKKLAEGIDGFSKLAKPNPECRDAEENTAV